MSNTPVRALKASSCRSINDQRSSASSHRNAIEPACHELHPGPGQSPESQPAARRIGSAAYVTMIGMSDDRDNSDVAGLRRRVGLSLRALGSDLDALDEAVAARFRLHRTDLRCLEIVGRGGPLSAGALAEQAGLSTSAVTSVIDRAERSRNLRRLSDPQDRRRVLVEVTEQGRRRGREAFSGLQQGTDRILRRYSPEELRLLGTFVEEVRSVVSAEAASAVSAAVATRGQGTDRRSAR
jgi:DNA-binding MarR family transcriptional regulator